jgi:hypothetical protein
MEVLEWGGFLVGLVLVILAADSVLRTLVVPRGLSSAVSRRVAQGVRRVFLFLANRSSTYEVKDRILALQAPTYLMALLFSWVVIFGSGYALMLWPWVEGGFGQAALESGSSMFTLGFAGTHTIGATVIHFVAAATGLVVVALLIAYLPTIYSEFNRRETVVTMLQSRAGVPAWGPEILARHQMVGMLDNLPDFFHEWERWAAEVTESHTNYPVLIWFRSPHPLRNWVLGLLSVLDAGALYLAFSPSQAPTNARLCMRMGFTCFRNIADFVRIPYDPDPLPTDEIELTYEEFLGGVHRMEEFGFPMERTPEEAWPHFRGWRVNYESVAYALADLIVAPPGPWSGERSHLPGMAIVPQRPANRQPDDPLPDRPKADRFGWHG